MRDFSKISPTVWQSERFNSLSDKSKLVYLYLLTNGHQTRAGCYWLPEGYACSDLRWPVDRYQKALKALVAADLVRWDESAKVIGITRWFKHNPPVSPDHLIGVERELARLPSEGIAKEALQAAQEAWASFQTAKTAKAAQKHNPARRLQTNYINGG